MQRAGRGLAQLLAEKLEGVARIIAQGGEALRREDEGDLDHVGRILSLADDAGVQVADPVLGVIGFGRRDEIGVGVRRHPAAEKALDLLVLLRGRLEHVDPDRPGRDRLGAVENRSRKPGFRNSLRGQLGVDGIVDNDHGFAPPRLKRSLKQLHESFRRADAGAAAVPRGPASACSILRATQRFQGLKLDFLQLDSMAARAQPEIEDLRSARTLAKPCESNVTHQPSHHKHILFLNAVDRHILM